MERDSFSRFNHILFMKIWTEHDEEPSPEHRHTHTYSLMQLSHTARAVNQEPTHVIDTNQREQRPKWRFHQNTHIKKHNPKAATAAGRWRASRGASRMQASLPVQPVLLPNTAGVLAMVSLPSGISTVLRIPYASEELLTDVDRPRSGSRIQGGVNFCRRFLSS